MRSSASYRFATFSAAFRLALLLGLLALAPAGCASQPGPYLERYEVDGLTVVFLDESSLHHEWQARSHRHHVQFMSGAPAGQPSLRVVRGFYDPSTRTIYCLKWDFEICGHELHHAVLGNFFHPGETHPHP